MPTSKKKLPRQGYTKVSSPLKALARRVTVLENDFHALRSDVANLSTEITSLKYIVAVIDRRTAKSELVLLAVQGEQHKMFRTMNALAEHFSVKVPPAVPASALPEGPDPEIDDGYTDEG
jgi:hypothetical protein